jgi:pyruvate dehydrogenase E2 component (dihydrolipoamide acetyltransferase)
MQRTIARRMAESKFSAPEFLLTAEIDMTEARALLRTVSEQEGAPKVGPNDLLIKVAGMALAQHPEVNSGWESDTVVRFGRVNVGIAVALPNGLVVPVVREVDRKSLGQIAREARDLIERARNGKLSPADYEGGTFTISNLGMYGIDEFTAIINPPEAAIMAVGAITSKPVVVEGEIVVRDRMRVTMSLDHRVINGAQGAEFLRTFRNLLEHPMLALI